MFEVNGKVEKFESLLNQDRLMDDEAIEFIFPFDPTYAKPCPRPIFKLVVDAVINEEYAVDEEYPNVILPKLSIVVVAVPPKYADSAEI